MGMRTEKPMSAKPYARARTATEVEPEITQHVEPAEQGGAVYFRCECGREAMRRGDLRSDYHQAECFARRGR